MNNMTKIIISFILLLLASTCQFESIEDEDLDLTNTNPFVRFDQNDLEAKANEGDTITLEIESPSSLEESITVQYTVTSDNAVFGTDYTIDGASLNGSTVSGSFVLMHFPDSNGFFNSFDLELISLIDNVNDGDKTITVTLTSASASGASVDVGQGPINGSSIVTLGDIDFLIDLNGTYNSVNCFPDPVKTSVWVERSGTPGTYDIADFTGGYYGFASAPDIAAVIVTKGTSVSIEDFDFADVLLFRDITGTIDQKTGVITLSWTEESGFGNQDVPVVCSTVFTPEE